ncbi:MAG: DNA helicase RecQ [Magnetococcales bacterium]|nr:DNA helicase RecQ [Magnetococcales bacterium]
MHDNTPSALSILKKRFGYTRFRGAQAEIIAHIQNGGDALVVMPTGGGKSLCYQIPSLLRPGMGIIVSPLIALMQDQVSALVQNGIRAAFINSSQSAHESREVMQRAAAGDLDILYMAPERLVMTSTLAFLSQQQIALFAIDEAHCVSQWGHDFRPDYLHLSLLAERFPSVPRIALTATADGITRDDILHRLAMGSATPFVAGFDRPNIRYRIVIKNNPRRQLRQFLESEHPTDSGIVYCLSRKRVEAFAEWLCDQGYRALPYHAGLPASTRRENQAHFLREEGIIMVATIAFGMGIDKPDVRFVAHMDLPKSVEAYYQETGRAGRDGLPSTAFMTYGYEDVVMLRQFVENSNAEENIKRIENQKLDALLGLCETTSCRRQGLLGYFGEEHPGECGNCDACLEPAETWDGLIAAQKALSCVYRTGQRFGVSYLSDVLLGKHNERIQQFGHHRVSTFGIGTELNNKEWRSVYRQLVAAGYLMVDISGHGGLRLTERSRPILQGKQKVLFRKERRGRNRSGSERTTVVKRQAVVFDSAADRALFETLYQLRDRLAREQSLPPFVVMMDRTLEEIAVKKPINRTELAMIHGIVERKLEQYATPLLETVEEHLRKLAQQDI